MKLTKFILIALAATACTGMNQKAMNGDKKPAMTMSSENIVNTLQDNNDYSTLMSLVKEADLSNTLEGKGPFVLFAPTNKAFSMIPQSTLDSLKQDKEKLKNVLLFHVVSGDYSMDQLKGMSSIRTAEGSMLTISMRNGKLYVDDAEVTDMPMKASNGMIFTVDKVLMPSN